ncbi:MAG: DNA-3-methyladenine glycosylase I [Actinomycetota bacterium]
MQPTRCAWAGTDERMVAYHDLEWGTPSHDDVHLFEMLTLEGAQAGLSWSTILNKREGYRSAFRGFDPGTVARIRMSSIDRLMADPGIVRNRLKIESTLHNAKRVVEVQREEGSFAAFVWSFIGDRPIVHAWRSLDQIPSETSESRAMSKELKRRDFRFVGPTVCYAFMEAVGMVNDHMRSCFRYAELRDAD